MPRTIADIIQHLARFGRNIVRGKSSATKSFLPLSSLFRSKNTKKSVSRAKLKFFAVFMGGDLNRVEVDEDHQRCRTMKGIA
jgi:hypothetical protein